MLDVYRNYYGLTGEPFRLGPDYRFSLHHESYANAKAYLEYAIYQGEGFIAITGGPGTGKTTLISEILAGLDQNKVQVATLTSTQLESRDLLYMVATSFDLHLEDASKANLLVEIESFLVRRIREGQRAILIVDEAQGLSAGALEELRLLANLQYQYQLLLQIFLVGQDQLLELIRAPGMEHLHQRLVAATSLEPLSFDETINYIEHRLSKVGWDSVPAFEEGALREIYRYSGGVPRRINLIANRLFLYGGMEEKHSFDAEDTRNVIQGLIEEFLLAPEPLIAEVELGAVPTSGGETRTRSLPREPRDDQNAGNTRKEETAAGRVDKRQKATAPGTAAAPTGPTAKETPTTSAGTRRPDSSNHKPGAPAKAGAVAPKPTSASAPQAGKRAVQMDRPVPRRSPRVAPRKPKKKAGTKGAVIAVVLLAGAGAGYLLRQQSSEQNQVYKAVDQGAKSAQRQTPPAPDRKVAKPAGQPAIDRPTDNNHTGILVKSIGESERGEIIREQPPEPPAMTESGQAGTPRAAAPTEVEANEAVSQVPVKSAKPAKPATTKRAKAEPAKIAPAQAALAKAESVKAEPAPVPVKLLPNKPQKTKRPVPPAAAEKRSIKKETRVSEKPRKTAEHLARADAAIAKPVAGGIEARRAELKQAAEQRFSARQSRVQVKPEPVSVTPVRKTTQTASLSKPAPAQKKPSYTRDGIMSALLDGRWSSRDKPASLLPSETTICNKQVDRINCLSVPKNIKTKYGLALYKVETTLSGFSPEGLFEMSYRTLVRLVGSESEQGVPRLAGADSDGWQISAYSMSCKLLPAGKVSCLDGKGVRREYRSGSGKR